MQQNSSTVNPNRPGTDECSNVVSFPHHRLVDWAKYKPVTLPPENRPGISALGYEPIPINGKAPHVLAWRDAEITPKWLDHVAVKHPDHEGTGIRTGHVAGIDVDIVENDDLCSDVAHVIEKVFGPIPLARRGSKGYLIPISMAAPIAKRVLTFTDGNGRGHKIEILGAGQQFAAFGHVPESPGVHAAFDYKWFKGESPLDVHTWELPSGNAAKMDEFIRLATERLTARGCTFGVTAGKLRGKSADRGSAVFEDDPAVRERAIDFLEKRPGALQEGHNGPKGVGGDQWTFETACWLRDIGCSEHVTLELMWENWNHKCDPTWNFDGAKSLSSKVSSAYRNGQNKAGDKVPLIDIANRQGVLDPTGGDSELPAKIKTEETVRQLIKSSLMPVDEFCTATADFVFFVEGLLAFGGVNEFLGKRGGGKTTLAIDLAMHLACDLDWHGYSTEKGMHVVYVPIEDKSGVKMRIEGWLAAHPEAKFDRSRFHVLNHDLQAFRETTKEEARELVAVLKELIAEQGRAVKAAGGRKVLFIFDTWQRFSELAPNGQSDDKGMAEAMEVIENMLEEFVKGDTEARAAGLVLCHPPKANSETVHGSVIIENKSFTVMKIESNEKGTVSTATLERSKASQLGQSFNFRLEPVTLPGRTQHGKPRSSVVAMPVSATATESAAKPMREVTEKDTAYRQRVIKLVADQFVQRSETKVQSDHAAKLKIEAEVSRRLDSGLSRTQANADLPSPTVEKRTMAQQFGDREQSFIVDSGTRSLVVSWHPGKSGRGNGAHFTVRPNVEVNEAAQSGGNT